MGLTYQNKTVESGASMCLRRPAAPCWTSAPWQSMDFLGSVFETSPGIPHGTIPVSTTFSGFTSCRIPSIRISLPHTINCSHWMFSSSGKPVALLLGNIAAKWTWQYIRSSKLWFFLLLGVDSKIDIGETWMIWNPTGWLHIKHRLKKMSNLRSVKQKNSPAKAIGKMQRCWTIDSNHLWVTGEIKGQIFEIKTWGAFAWICPNLLKSGIQSLSRAI